jgi:phage gp36-like protein
MSYATVDDMVTRFGAAEMIRASTPDGAPAVALIPAPIQAALDDATSLIDGYLRKRYRVPLDLAPQEINAACCILARYTLATGGERNPSDQVKADRAEKLAWLKLVAQGGVSLGVEEIAPGGESYAQQRTRGQVFQDQEPLTNCGFGGGAGFDGGFFGGGFP